MPFRQPPTTENVRGNWKYLCHWNYYRQNRNFNGKSGV